MAYKLFLTCLPIVILFFGMNSRDQFSHNIYVMTIGAIAGLYFVLYLLWQLVYSIGMLYIKLWTT